jgi:hypothetical protein
MRVGFVMVLTLIVFHLFGPCNLLVIGLKGLYSEPASSRNCPVAGLSFG